MVVGSDREPRRKGEGNREKAKDKLEKGTIHKTLNHVLQG